MRREGTSGCSGRPPSSNVGRLLRAASALAVVVGAGCTTDSAIITSSRGGVVPKAGADAGGDAAATGAHLTDYGGPGVTPRPGGTGGARPTEPVRGNSNRSGTNTSETVAFVCSHWEDDDNDGVMDYPDEFRGIGGSFRTTDRIAICFQTRLTRPYRRTFLLYAGDRSVVLERSKDLPGSPVLKMTVLQYKPGQLAAGSYEATWSVNGGVAGTARFEVVE